MIDKMSLSPIVCFKKAHIVVVLKDVVFDKFHYTVKEW